MIDSQAFFITGTDTEIGKTTIASALLRAFAMQGWSTVGMKPIAAGASLHHGQWCNEDVDALDAASTVHPPLALRCPYLMRTPAAPHLAAQMEHITLDETLILQRFALLRETAQRVVVEGVGGFRVPLNDRYDTADLAVALNLPVILVVGLRLGCINQALLTQEAIASRGLTLVGWVANSTQNDMALESDNIAALAQRLSAPCLGHVPRLKEAQLAQAHAYLDITRMTAA